MSRSGLENHERNTCPKLAEPEPEPELAQAEEEKPVRWRQVTQAGGAIGWIRE